MKKGKLLSCLALLFVVALLAVCIPKMSLKAEAALTLHWPVPGHFNITQNYHANHGGIDISDSKISGAPIVSVCDGTVVRVRNCAKNHDSVDECTVCYGSGNGLLIKGTDGRYYSYAHMKAGSVKGFVANKTKVKAGQVIGYVGNTGYSKGTHLHFSISKDTAYKTCYNPEKETFINTGVENPFTFSRLDSKISVSNTDAVIAVRVTKPLENRMIKYGAAIYSENGVKLASVSANSSITADTKTIDLFWTVSTGLKITLKPGTKYYFDFWANVSGVTLTSSRYSFTTTGTPSYTVECYSNYSGKNYFVDSDFTNGLNTARYASRNSAVYTLSVDTAEKHDARYNSLKIVGATAGNISSNDMKFLLTTNMSRDHQNYVDSSSDMILSFWAKSSVNGAKLYFRWGYQGASEDRAVTLTDQWKYYTILMPREAVYGSALHPYFDKAGTVWLSELQMEDGNTATSFVPENGQKTSFTVTPGTTYSALPTPTRNGYIFDGWYTGATGGTQVKSTDAVKKGNIALYAHWVPQLKITQQPSSVTVASGNTAKVTVKAAGEGLTYAWYYKNAGSSKFSLTTSFTGNSYSIAMNDARKGRQVYCVITDQYGNSVTTNTVTLNMYPGFTITTQPANKIVKAGVTAKFTVKINGKNVTYQWQYKTSSSGSWKNASATGNKTATLSVPASVSRHGYQYRCKITDSAGNVIYTKTVNLYVLGIKTQPVNKTVKAGATAKFTVKATGKGLTYQWQYRTSSSGSWKNVSAASGKTANYSLTAAARHNGYFYRCKITDSSGNVIYTSIVKLTVK